MRGSAALWLALGTAPALIRQLERAGLRPMQGGDEFNFGSPDFFGASDPGWLNMIDMSGATVAGTPWDQVVAATQAAAPVTYTYDAAGNIYNASGTMVMNADQVNARDPMLNADLQGLMAAEAGMGGSFANADPGGAGAGGQTYYYNPATGGVDDANGTQVYSAYDIQQAGLTPADLGVQSDAAISQVAIKNMMTPNGWGTSPAGITIDGQGNAIDARSGQVLASDAEMRAAGINPATMTGQELDAAFGASAGGGDAATAAARDAGLTSAQFSNTPLQQGAGLLPYLQRALEAAGVPAGMVPALASSLATGAIGGAGLLAGQLIGGKPQNYTPTLAQPTVGQGIANAALQQPQNAQALQDIIGGSLAGQRGVVDWTNQNLGTQAPAYSAIQNQSLAALLQHLPGTTPADPTTTGLQERVLQALNGQDNPALARAFREQTETMRNLGAIRGGPGGAGSYFQSTPGIEAATKLGESQGIQRYQDYLNTITSLSPQYTQARTTDQNIASQQLRERTGLAGLQPTAPVTLGSLYNQNAPVSQIAGYGQNVSAFNANIQNQAAQASIQAQNTYRQSLGNNVGRLIGNVGSSLVTGQPNL